MRLIIIFAALFSALACAQAKDLIGSDQQAYSQELQITSQTLP